METLKEELFLIPKGSNGLRLHPRAFVDEHIKSYEKVTGILLSAEEVEKLKSDKAELLEALESVKRLEPIICMGGALGEQWQNEAQELNEMMSEIESLIQKMKP